MSQPVALLFGVHMHQPVGNFPEVLRDAHLRCYQPFIRTLYDYPDFRFSLHTSGWLLDFLEREYPEDIALLRQMVARGQVELFGGGDTEPVLAVIPYRDRVGQVRALSERLYRTLGARPQGAWLTERVWEATVVPGLADAGIEFVTVDDYHFLCAGQDPAQLRGYYTTEEDGRTLDLFPIMEGLRYRIPFAQAHDAVHYIHSLAEPGRQAAAIYFDDIEKFGIWPDTYAWVYEQGWLRHFIEGVLHAPQIENMHFAEYRSRQATHGIIYLPTTSYIEMNEWTLPAPRANTFHGLVEASKSRGAFDQDKPFLRGGIWKNFFTRYPESNWMHKRMLALSARFHEQVARVQEGGRIEQMQHLLYQTQTNDAYWHGLFGGLYLPHLRRAVYHAALELESLLDHESPRPACIRRDINLDGIDDMMLQNGILQAILPLDGAASIRELDFYPLAHNFGDTLARQPEHYHRLVQGEFQHDQPQHGGIASAHDRVAFKDSISAADLASDGQPRTLFRDFIQPDPQAGWQACHYTLAPAEMQAPQVRFDGQGLHKEIQLAENALLVRYQLAAGQPFKTELNLAMPCCNGPAGQVIVDGEVLGGFGQIIERSEVTQVRLWDAVLGGSIDCIFSGPVYWHSQPYHTVSQSEAGFEKIMQAFTVTLSPAMDAESLEIRLVFNRFD